MARSLYTHAKHMLACLYVMEAALVLIGIGIYKTPVEDRVLLTAKTGTVLAMGGVGLLASTWLLLRRIRAAGSLWGEALVLASTTNVVLGLLLFLLSEASLHLVAKKSPEGLHIGAVLVRPTWKELVAQSRDVLSRVTSWEYWDASYFVFDPQLGWTVGSNRKSADGMYFSSVEGIRSGAPGVHMASDSMRYRVALVGDSNAFSSEVPFEESWGQHLQRLLGADVQVLNFGVDGYGIDQMLLRYERDIRPWSSDVVLVGLIGHDLRRTMAVYPFVSFGWPGYVVKPRFVIEEGRPHLLNVPLPTPGEILGAASPHQLPFVEYDLGYQSGDWYWRTRRLPLVVRYLTSRFPRWSSLPSEVSREATEELNGLLLTRLVQAIEQDGAAPVVVLLSESGEALERQAEEILTRAHIHFLRGTECLSEVPVERRHVPSGIHYTGAANLAIARCTGPAVERALGR